MDTSCSYFVRSNRNDLYERHGDRHKHRNSASAVPAWIDNTELARPLAMVVRSVLERNTRRLPNLPRSIYCCSNIHVGHSSWLTQGRTFKPKTLFSSKFI